MMAESIERYVELYGRVHYSTATDIPWPNVPMDRLEQKLRLVATFAENIASWGYCQFGRPHLGPKTKQWYDTYRQYYEQVKNDS